MLCYSMVSSSVKDTVEPDLPKRRYNGISTSTDSARLIWNASGDNVTDPLL